MRIRRWAMELRMMAATAAQTASAAQAASAANDGAI